MNLLRVAIRNHAGVPYRCASGKCGTDRVHVEDGADHLSPMRARERDRLGPLAEEGWRLACQTYVSGDCAITWDPDQRPLDDTVGNRLEARWLDARDTD